MTAPRLPNVNTSFARMFERSARKIDDSNERAFRRLHRLSKRNFPDGVADFTQPAIAERAARALAADTLFALNEYTGRVAPEWYTHSIRDAISVISVGHPELRDIEAASRLSHVGIETPAHARCILMAAIAITSQGVPVRANARVGLDQYRFFLEHGRFNPISVGPSGRSVLENLSLFNSLLETCEGSVEVAKTFLDTRFTVREFKAIGARNGLDVNIKERLDTLVHGSTILGPKIGSFYQNLVGNDSTLTIDMWLMRTWGRITGSLMNDDVPALQTERLMESLQGAPAEARAIALEAMAPWDVEDIITADVDRMSDISCELVLEWERRRRDIVKAGASADDVSRTKAEWRWPHAAQAMKSYVAAPNDQPRSMKERNLIRSVFERARQIVRLHGHDLSVSGMQAILWYPEKHLVSHLSGRREPEINMSFDRAFYDLFLEYGYEERRLGKAIEDGSIEIPSRLTEKEKEPSPAPMVA